MVTKHHVVYDVGWQVEDVGSAVSDQNTRVHAFISSVPHEETPDLENAANQVEAWDQLKCTNRDEDNVVRKFFKLSGRAAVPALVHAVVSAFICIVIAVNSVTVADVHNWQQARQDHIEACEDPLDYGLSCQVRFCDGLVVENAWDVGRKHVVLPREYLVRHVEHQEVDTEADAVHPHPCFLGELAKYV